MRGKGRKMILEAKKKYEENKISDIEYDIEMMKGHRVLLEYAELLKTSVCSKIEITKEGVKCRVPYGKQGFNMYLNDEDLSAVSSQLLAYNEYESLESNMVAKIVKELDNDSVIFDVGANLGWYTLLMNSVNKSANYYAFEPVEKTYNRLIQNLRENGMNVDYCKNLGFYHENKEMEFYYDVAASGASSLVNLRGMDTVTKIICKMIKLDDFVNENVIPRLDFMKCDVEGAELFVLQGGSKTISEYQPVIFCEMLRKWSAKFKYHPNDILELLYGFGYECFVIDQCGNLKKFGMVDEDTIETNYFFFHKEKHLQMMKRLGRDE